MQASKDPKGLVPPDLARPYSHRPGAGSQVPPISTAHWAEMLVHLAAAASAGTAPAEHIPSATIANTTVRSIAVLPRKSIPFILHRLEPNVKWPLFRCRGISAVQTDAAPRRSGGSKQNRRYFNPSQPG